MAALLACTLSLAACAQDDGATGDGSPATASSSATITTSDDRVAHGCALLRGGTHADSMIQYYSDRAAHALFEAALEAEPGWVTAAQLWNAADRLLTDGSSGPRSTLLKICTEAGFNDTAGLPELRVFACEVSSHVALERPDVQAYGPKSTKAVPGDPLRTDVRFLDVVSFLLSVKESSDWLEVEGPGFALASGQDGRYKVALDHFEEMCSSPSPSQQQP